METLFNIIATDNKTGEQFIEKYDFTKGEAEQWIINNKSEKYTYSAEEA